MLRVDRSQGALTVVSRLARARVVAVVGGGLAALALAVARPAPRAAAALACAAALVVILGARSQRARFERGQVAVRQAMPFFPTARRVLGGFTGARVEVFAEARRTRAERLARGWAERSGTPMPAWLRAPEAPGTNDALRRIVLVPVAGEPFPVTAWLAEDEDLEPARLAIEAVLR